MWKWFWAIGVLLVVCAQPAEAQRYIAVTACGTLNVPAPLPGATPIITYDLTGKICADVAVSASVAGFPTTQTTGTPISVTTGGVSGTLPSGTVVVASNVGTTNGAYCKLGASATTSDQFIAPNGGWFAFTVGAATQLTCITASSTTTVNMVGGSGLPTGTGGGGGGGAGGGDASAANQLLQLTQETAVNTALGAVGDAACATDNGSCSSIALIKRTNQRLTTINTTLGSPFQAGGSIGNTTFAATQATAANLNATVVGTGTFATQSAVTAASGSYASGAFASGAHASGSFASGAFASGSIASGAIAAGAQVDLLTMRGTKNAGTAAANSLLAGGVYNSTPLTLIDTQQSSLQFDANGYLKVNTAAGAAAGGTSSNFGSGFPTPGTAVGFTDGTNMVAGRVGAVANVAAATNLIQVLGVAQYNATPLTVTDTRYQSLQSDVNGFLKVNVATATGIVPGTAVGTLTGSAILCSVTTAAPAYTTGQYDKVNCQTDGSQRVAVTNTITVGTHAVTVASGGIASGAVASGAYASGSIGSGAVASGAYASGALASGSIASGAMVDVGAQADAACSTDNGTCTLIALTKRNNQRLTTVNSSIGAANAYETVAASQTAQSLGATGATGDYLSHCVATPGTTSPGVVTILDNATAIVSFAGGASSVSNLVPFPIPIGAVSVSGAWKITTGANVTVVCVGRFT